jgi:hypothetical protein
MICYKPPNQEAVGIGEHIEGIGTVLDPDDELMATFLKSMEDETRRIDILLRNQRVQIAKAIGEIR